MTMLEPAEVAELIRVRHRLLDAVTLERFGVHTARCPEPGCDWTTGRNTDAYARSALLAHHEHQHVSQHEKARRRRDTAARGRRLVAEALEATA